MLTEQTKVKTIRIIEILLSTSIISLISSYTIGYNSPAKVAYIHSYFLVAAITTGLTVLFKFSTILRYVYPFYFLTIFLLVGVLLNGYMAGGATRWISIGCFKFQPSELLKFALPLTLIKYYQSKPLPLSKKRIYTSIFIIGGPVLLVLYQPDLGTSIVIIITALCVPFLLGLRKKTIWFSIALILIMLPILWNLLLPYQQMRILAYLWPQDYSDSAYQVKQAIFAIKKGALVGRNDTTPNVPAGSTDFIFSIFAFRFGAFGLLILLTLYKRLINSIIYLAKSTPSPILAALSGSYAFLLSCSILINILMVTGILPVVGLPLPFMSYGGTAFLVNIVILTILVTAFKSGKTYSKNSFSPQFLKSQQIRLKLLSKFSNIAMAIILIRILLIYL